MTKSTSYRQTFRRHRILLTVPIVLAVVISALLVLSKAPSYNSTANLWVFYPRSTNSALTKASPGIIPPAQVEQGVFKELLATRSFALDVGHSSALGPYLAKGGGSLDTQIVLALGATQVSSSTPGPQVLQIGYTGPTPAVTRSTLAALVTQLQRRSAQFGAGNVVQAIDPPSAAISMGSHKKQLLTVLGGLFAGVLISFLGAVALTRGKPNPLEDPNVALLAAVPASPNGNHNEAQTTQPRPIEPRPLLGGARLRTGADSAAVHSAQASLRAREVEDEPERSRYDDSSA